MISLVFTFIYSFEAFNIINNESQTSLYYSNYYDNNNSTYAHHSTSSYKSSLITSFNTSFIFNKLQHKINNNERFLTASSGSTTLTDIIFVASTISSSLIYTNGGSVKVANIRFNVKSPELVSFIEKKNNAGEEHFSDIDLSDFRIKGTAPLFGSYLAETTFLSDLSFRNISASDSFSPFSIHSHNPFSSCTIKSTFFHDCTDPLYGTISTGFCASSFSLFNSSQINSHSSKRRHSEAKNCLLSFCEFTNNSHSGNGGAVELCGNTSTVVLNGMELYVYI